MTVRELIARLEAIGRPDLDVVVDAYGYLYVQPLVGGANVDGVVAVSEGHGPAKVRIVATRERS